LLPPRQLRVLEGPEHGRTIPLPDMGEDSRGAKVLFLPVLVRFDACFRSALKSHF